MSQGFNMVQQTHKLLPFTISLLYGWPYCQFKAKMVSIHLPLYCEGANIFEVLLTSTSLTALNIYIKIQQKKTNVIKQMLYCL